MSNVTFFGIKNRLTFGKYKGKMVEEVLESDPEYLMWAHTNIDWFVLDEEALADALLLTTGKCTRAPKEKGAPSKKDDTPLFDTSKQQQPKLFDNFDDNDKPF